RSAKSVYDTTDGQSSDGRPGVPARRAAVLALVARRGADHAGESVRDLASSMAPLGGIIVREVAVRDRSESGRVRLAAPDGLAGYVLMPRLPAFQRSHPDIQLAVDCGLWTDSPIGGSPDLSLEMTGSAQQGVASTPVATLHYAYFASR